MKAKKRVPIVQNFWQKTEKEPDATLYEDQLGWTIPIKVEAGGYTDTHDIWENIMERTSPDIVGWDLCFYYPPTGTFYYIDQINRVLFKVPKVEGWDGEAIFQSVEMRPQNTPDEYELMDFDNVSEVWDNFKIDGKDMKYILEHSVLFLST